MRLAVVGGGGFRVPLVYEALLRGRDEVPVHEVVLHDVDARRVRVVVEVLRQMSLGAADPPRLVVADRLDDALGGADLVFSSVRVGGLAGRVADERVAVDLGLLGQETTGAGGIAYGLRTVPVAVHLAERVAALTPEAWVLNFTNPAGMVTEAMAAVLGDRVIGVCDSPAGLCRRVARALGVPPERTWFDYVGLNHLGWLRAVLVDGRDHLPRLLADDRLLGSFEEGRLFGADWLRALGAIPNGYLWYWHVDRGADRPPVRRRTRGEQLRDQQERFYATVEADPSSALVVWRRVRRERDETYLAESRDADVATGRDPGDVDDGGYERVALDVVAAIAGNRRSVHVLDVRNRGAMRGLDDDAVVEVPCVVDGNGAHPVAAGEVEPHQLGLLQTVKAVEREAVAAALEGSRDRAIRAFALHPLVGSPDRARRLLDGYRAAHPELVRLQ